MPIPELACKADCNDVDLNKPFSHNFSSSRLFHCHSNGRTVLHNRTLTFDWRVR